MEIWNGIKKAPQKAANLIKAGAERLQASLDSMIPSKGHQYAILILFIFCVCLLAYIIALFDIGIWVGTASIFKMVNAYQSNGRSYPLFVLLIFTIFLAVGFYIVLKLITRDKGRNFKYSDEDTYGSAREISIEDLEKVADVKPIEALSGTILGQLDTTGRRVIGIPPNPIMNKNLIVFGTPGDGKSFSIVENAIVQAIRRGESVVCTDTKYEVRADTLELARRYGYTVRFLDLKDLLYSDGWNVLKELRCDDVRAVIFAEIVMKNTGNLHDPHLALEQSLLRACCLYTERCRSIPDSERTFYHAYSMILQGPEALDKLFAEAKYDKDLRVAYDAYASFKGSDNLRGNVIANLSSRLQILPTARTMTSTDDIDLSLPGQKKCIYYCCMSDLHESMKFLATLFFSFLFLDLVDYADTRIDRRLPVPVNVILEEAANIGEIVNLERYLATARSRAISITLILQSLGQLQQIYGENTTQVILNTCSIHACIGTNDETTANHFEWLSGTSTIKVRTEQHPELESPFKSRFNHSTGDGKRSVFTSNEIRKIRRGYIVLAWKGYDTLMCHTFGINQHPEYKKGHMTVIEPHTHVPLANTEARAFIRAMEEQRVMDYEKWEQDGGFAWDGYGFPEPQYNGPSRGTPAPKVIPYPELEQMALDHAEQAEATFKEEFREKVAQQKAAEQGTDDIIELPPDLEWLDAPCEEEPEDIHAEPATGISHNDIQPKKAQEGSPVGPTPPPIVMPEQKRKFEASPTDAFTPPTITKPKKSSSATLYGKQIPKQK